LATLYAKGKLVISITAKLNDFVPTTMFVDFKQAWYCAVVETTTGILFAINANENMIFRGCCDNNTNKWCGRSIAHKRPLWGMGLHHLLVIQNKWHNNLI